MWINPETRMTFQLALHLAIQWEESVLDCYESCNDKEAIRIKNETRANIYKFQDMQIKLQRCK